ncbi:MAG TPA: M28 family metallopeptidase [Vicinamibacterales bacterium]|nr:M28 family metallopeptidase [Vicinamibacterales bacterium]
MKKLLLLFVVLASLDVTAQGSPAWDAMFRVIPEAGNIGEYMRIMSARPHHLGSPYGKENAEWMLAKFKEWGWDARIENYDVLFPTPKERLVEMVAPTRLRLSLEEPAVGVDPTSSQRSEQLPSFNAYSVDGDVTAPLVYVNYGRPVDYQELDRRGISVKGAIVIVRYGASWRGIKPKVAAERGAIGCLIYSDPRDDGYYVDGVFPDGPMRNKDGVQRGSVMDMPTFPGDPTTPGRGSIPGAERLDLNQTTTLTRIPVLPISYGDAQPLLAALAGDVVPMDWRGGLPITYRTGPGPVRVHLKVAFDWSLKRVHNVIARLEGSMYPDEWIVRGNHHDAWVNGAQDPASGMSAELEEARALGELVKQGWRPRRTIVYAAWDGEEQGLLGSTEWVEHHQAELRDKAVVYINTDGNGRGFLNVGGSHALEAVVNSVAQEVEDPQTKVSVWKRMQALEIRRGPAAVRNEARSRPDLRIDALGSGSDYSAFLQHAGIPTLNLSFGGLDPGDGIYHSIYDDYYYFTKFLDTDFTYGRALAQTVGSLVIRFADADILPFQFTNLADTVQTYVTELQTLLRDAQAEIRETNRQIEEGVFTALADSRRPFRQPVVESVPPSINFAPLENAAAQLTQAAERYRKSLEASRARLTPDVIQTINKRLIHSERQLTDTAGLPRRPWYRHLLYAPGYYTGYAVKTMPGVREALEEKNYAEAEREIARVADALSRGAALIDELTSALDKLSK